MEWGDERVPDHEVCCVIWWTLVLAWSRGALLEEDLQVKSARARSWCK